MGFDAHFFRKVPNDVTEATKVGGLISVLAVVTIFWLVRQEYAEFAAPKHVSVLSLDTSTLPSPLGAEAFENIRINFNITMLRMPCQYATLQIADHVGSHKVGGTRNVHKVMLDANGRSLGVYTPHRYHTEGPGAEPEHMADHVFPWHKQMHTQGDAAHREAQGKAHMSLEQAEHVRGVEAEMEKGSAVKPGAPSPARAASSRPTPLRRRRRAGADAARRRRHEGGGGQEGGGGEGGGGEGGGGEGGGGAIGGGCEGGGGAD